MAQIAVIGAGTWGTGLARLLCDNGHTVRMWCPFEEEAENLSRTHIQPNLPGIILRLYHKNAVNGHYNMVYLCGGDLVRRCLLFFKHNVV